MVGVDPRPDRNELDVAFFGCYICAQTNVNDHVAAGSVTCGGDYMRRNKVACLAGTCCRHQHIPVAYEEVQMKNSRNREIMDVPEVHVGEIGEEKVRGSTVLVNAQYCWRWHMTKSQRC
jgi:hypothetical protein